MDMDGASRRASRAGGGSPASRRSGGLMTLKTVRRLAVAATLAVGLAAPDRAGSATPDFIYGAYQRGDYQTAFSLATKAVEEYDVKAMTMLGVLYSEGLVVPQDDKKATEWYKLAAARGDANAMLVLAMFTLNGRAG